MQVPPVSRKKKKCMNGALWWTDVPSRVYSCLEPRVPLPKSDTYPASQTQILILSTGAMHPLKNKSFMVLWCTCACVCACASVCKAVAQLLDTNPDKGDPYSMSIHAIWCFCSWKLPQQTAQTSRMWQQSYTPRISTLHCILDTQVNCVLCTYIQFTITQTYSAWNDRTNDLQVDTASGVITERFTAGK